MRLIPLPNSNVSRGWDGRKPRCSRRTSGGRNRSTGRGQERLDQVWISPELQGSVVAVKVCNDVWADHATVEVDFCLSTTAMVSDVWRKPQAMDWPKQWECSYHWDAQASPTAEYARFWSQMQQTACQVAEDEQRTWSANQLGRGHTLRTVEKQCYQVPLRASRAGDVKPDFLPSGIRYGLSSFDASRQSSVVAVPTSALLLRPLVSSCRQHGMLSTMLKILMDLLPGGGLSIS